MRLFVGLFVALTAVVASEAAARCFPRQSYPSAPRDESIVDDYFGVKVKDPYRWLENPDLPETKKFIEDQNRISRPYLDSNPVKREIKERLTELWNYPKYSTPVRAGDKYFYFKNSGLQNQDVLYVQTGIQGEPKVFLDPNALSQDGSVSIAKYEPSNDGAVVAYTLSQKGSDWATIRFKDVETDKIYPEILEYVKFGEMAWTKDNKGIFYSRYPAENGSPVGSATETIRNNKLYYHKLNTPQSEDILVFEYPQEPLWRVTGTVSEDGKYLLVSLGKDPFFTVVYYADLSATNYEISNKLKFVPLIQKLEAEYHYITNEGSLFLFRTNKKAPNFKLIVIDLEKPEEKYWKDIVPEHEKDVLDAATAVSEDRIVLHYIRDVKSVLQLFSLKSGKVLQEFELETGSVDGFFGKKKYNDAFFHFTSFLTPGTVYRIDFDKQPLKPYPLFKAELKGFDPSLYEVKQVFYPSKDGTKIPMFLIYKKGLLLDGSNPVLMSGYGGFGVNIQPTFNQLQFVFMQNFNGIVAIPNLRGGGEYGENWHRAGSLLYKQNTFDDFIAAAEYLVAEKYTKPALITIEGKSNGGLLVAASMNQRPDLFGVVINRVGVLDMLRYHKFTVGYAWASDYGTSENQTEFFNLFKYSPLHNIRTPVDHRFEYPATLVLTGDHDDRVVPAHSLKYIATLQHSVQLFRQYRPLLARIDTGAGHGGGKSTSKLIDEYTDILSFISQALALKFSK